MRQNTLLAALLAAAVYYFYSKKKDEQIAVDDGPTGGIKPPPVLTNTIPQPTGQANANYPIVYMRYHPDVKQLQKALKVTQDGVIGPITLAKLSQVIDSNITPSSLSIGSYGDLLRIIDIAKRKLG
jgi:murein L,D-transpeptidase YcbB/YkuD